MSENAYDIDIVIQGFPGKSVCHGGLGWSSVVLLRGHGRVALGHRRLSVIDLSSNGRGPMSNEDGTVWITYNGEIYNFRELKTRFRIVEKGHRFR